MSLPIDAQVSAKLKAKIWVNGFLDFGLLLSSTPGGARYNISVTANAGSGAPTLCLHSPHKRPNPCSIEMWTSAFQMFVGLYTMQGSNLVAAIADVKRKMAVDKENGHSSSVSWSTSLSISQNIEIYFEENQLPKSKGFLKLARSELALRWNFVTFFWNFFWIWSNNICGTSINSTEDNTVRSCPGRKMLSPRAME